MKNRRNRSLPQVSSHTLAAPTAGRIWLVPLGLFLLALFTYSNSFQTGFPLDNKGLILEDARIRAVSGQNFHQILDHTYWWPVGESGLYRPFTTLTYLFNYAVLGNADQPAGYHWINFLLHAGNVILVWLLARRFWREFRPPVFLAVLWCVHPVLTESVTNIVGRADLLAGTAILGGLLLYWKGAESAGGRRIACLAGLFALTTVGVFSKESAATLLGVILLSWFLPAESGLRKRDFAGVAVVLVPILWMLLQRAHVLSAAAPTDFPFTDNPIVGADFWTGRLTAVAVIARYLALLVWPVTLSCDYSYAQIPLVTGTASDWLAWLSVAAVTLAVILIFRRRPVGLFVAGAAFLVFLPTANLLFPFGAVMAERFLYLPSIAFAALVVWAAWRFPKIAPGALCVLIALFAVRTFARNADWQDDLTLSASAIRAVPHSFKAHKLRANALLESDASHGNIAEVIAQAEESLAILDSLPDALNNADMYQRASGYYFMKGDLLRHRNPDGSWLTPPESIAAYQRALQLLERSQTIARTPTPDTLGQIAKLNLRLGQNARALEAATRARALAPDNPEPHREIVGILVDADREHDAVVALIEGVLLTKDAGLRQTLANLYRGGCAFTPSGDLNPSCPAVHADLCTAVAQAAALRVQTNRPDLAAQLRRTAVAGFGCPAQ
jgi:tetratricopeptide (TPR) repeat protein